MATSPGACQGLLLYYMGVTAQDDAATTKALSYLHDRAKRSAAKSFPGPIARYYLGEIDFLICSRPRRQGPAPAQRPTPSTPLATTC